MSDQRNVSLQQRTFLGALYSTKCEDDLKNISLSEDITNMVAQKDLTKNLRKLTQFCINATTNLGTIHIINKA